MARKNIIKKTILPFILFIGIFLITVSFSGCLTPDTTCKLVVSQKDGIVITRLEPSYDKVPVGDIITLVADLQNKGNAPARNVNLTLWAYPGFKLLDNDPYKDGITRKDPAEPDKTETTMNPPKLDICSEGDTQTVQWQLQAGCDPHETQLAIAADYDYASEGWASVFIVSSDEARKSGGKFTEKGQNQPSAGPIQVLIEPLQTEPVILSPTARSFDVRVKFKNLGNGVVGPDGGGDVRSAVARVDGPCSFSELNVGRDLTDDKKITWSTKNKNAISLRTKDQDAIKIAKLQVPRDKFDGFVKDFCKVSVSADYHYRTVEDVKRKIGITATPSQVQECRSGASCTDSCRDSKFDYGQCVPRDVAAGTTIEEICGAGTDATLVCQCRNFDSSEGVSKRGT